MTASKVTSYPEEHSMRLKLKKIDVQAETRILHRLYFALSRELRAVLLGESK
jgi:hypothetical protein